MVKLLTIMGWNVENFGASKYNASGAEVVEFIAQVIDTNQVDVAGLSELRSNLAGQIGQDIATKLNNLQGVAANWLSQPSNQFGKGRKEQYLFVWKGARVATYHGSPSGTPFQWLYADPAKPTKNIGFPNQISSHRPPFLGYFQVTVPGAIRQVLIAIMHSPGPGYWKDTRDAAQNIARVTEFKNNGDTCVLVGDFNIKYQTDAAVANSNGEAAFGDMVSANFVQAIRPIDDATSLTEPVVTLMVAGDYQNEPYDQIFFRTTGASPLTHRDAHADDLIQDCTNGAYLEDHLGAIVDAYAGNLLGTTTYGSDINHAFVDYRLYVSDHLPVLVEVHD